MPTPLLFSTDRELVRVLAGAGSDPEARVGGVLADWERQDKARRQSGAAARIGVETSILPDTEEDLRAVAGISDVPVYCRINGWHAGSQAELERAIDAGASEIFLPMVRRSEEVVAALDAARGRIGVGILVETADAVDIAGELAELPISRVYIGLMDLALDRNAPSIFTAIADGTVETVRNRFDVPVGVAGLTVPSGGHPIPASLLIAELVRIGADFSFLRRSFIRDSAGDPAKGVRAIREVVRTLKMRSEAEIARDWEALLARIRELEAGA
jgi:hypothetical protein